MATSARTPTRTPSGGGGAAPVRQASRNDTSRTADDSISSVGTTSICLENVDLSSGGIAVDLKPEPGRLHSNGGGGYGAGRDGFVASLDGSTVAVRMKDGGKLSAPRYLCVRRRLTKEGSNASRLRHHGGYATVVSSCKFRPYIYGIRVDGDRIHATAEGTIEIPADYEIRIMIFGSNLINSDLAFTDVARTRGSRCDNVPIAKIVTLSEENVISDDAVQFSISLSPAENGGQYYFCIKESGQVANYWVHQGDQPVVTLKPVGRLLPLWVQSTILCILLALSGLFSGLNLGLMTLDSTELKILEKCGTDAEKKYARIIYPLRKQSNYLLCSLLLGNVLVNSSLTILLDDLTSGMIAVIVSTMSIVVFGEIIPQAICSRHGLEIGAKTVWLTKLFMLLTFPLSYPISKILDKLLGEEIRNIYNRKRLMEFIRVTKDYNDLHNEEVDIITGALELSKKTVSDVMTRICDVFMVPYCAMLNFETVSDIMKQGYSRIPVYDGDRNNIVSLLNTKDLAFVDPDDNTPLKTLCEFYNHPLNYVFQDVTLDIMLNEFKKGRSHLAFVHKVNDEGDGDPFYEIVGIVTLEDVIEEIIQSEIIDETDVLIDNRKRQARKDSDIKQDFSEFVKLAGGDPATNVISPQLALAVYQFLSTSVEPFKDTHLSETVLKRLMSQKVYFRAKPGDESSRTLYQLGKPADYFVLLLEGRCHVAVGCENLVFESGSFNYFGIPTLSTEIVSPLMRSSTNSLSNSTSELTTSSKMFVPDYTVTVVDDTLYMKVQRTVYLSAYRATLMERKHKDDPESKEYGSIQSLSTHVYEGSQLLTPEYENPSNRSEC